MFVSVHHLFVTLMRVQQDKIIQVEPSLQDFYSQYYAFIFKHFVGILSPKYVFQVGHKKYVYLTELSILLSTTCNLYSITMSHRNCQVILNYVSYGNITRDSECDKVISAGEGDVCHFTMVHH